MKKDKEGFSHYQHIQRYGEEEVAEIFKGTTYIFPKLDGEQRQICRKNNEDNIELQIYTHEGPIAIPDILGSDILLDDDKLISFFYDYPEWHLFGEWLVPKEIKYEDEAIYKFYVFDVAKKVGKYTDGSTRWEYMNYEGYSRLLDDYDIDYIPCVKVLHNGSIADILDRPELSKYHTLGGMLGEGVVIKNYDYTGLHKQVWAKVVWREYEGLKNDLGVCKTKWREIETNLPVEERIIRDYLTAPYIKKEFYKFRDNGVKYDESRKVEIFLNMIFKSLVEEEGWHMIKRYKYPTIDYTELRELCNCKVMDVLEL